MFAVNIEILILSVNCPMKEISQFYVNTYFFFFNRFCLLLMQVNIAAITRDYSFSIYAKFSEKLTFRTPWYAHVRVYIRGIRNISFLENFAYFLNEWSPSKFKNIWSRLICRCWMASLSNYPVLLKWNYKPFNAWW